MINRNKNSAVARARAEMKQAVNSSRRQLNCKWEYLGRNNKADVEEHYREMILNTLDSTKYARTRFNRLLSELGVSDITQLSYDQLVYLAKEMGIGGVGYNTIDESVEVSSSRRSANRLNSSRYTKDKMLRAMEAAGYWYDDIDSQYDNCVVFRTEYGSVSFDNFNDVADWLDGVVFDDPAIDEEVYAILNSNRRVNSSRHMSYKTRKAVEYSINCARRRARYGR